MEVGTTPPERGQFSQPELQKLYTELVTRGEQSAADAVQVGLLIEEMDIADLAERMERTDNPLIQQVYQNLQRGSRNHLRAFHRQAQNRQVTYTPQYLSQAEYDQILAADHERGGGPGFGPGAGRRGRPRNRRWLRPPGTMTCCRNPRGLLSRAQV